MAGMLSIKDLTPAMVDDLYNQYQGMLTPVSELQPAEDPSFDAVRQQMYEQNLAMQNNGVPSNAMVAGDMPETMIPQGGMLNAPQPVGTMDFIGALGQGIMAKDGETPFGDFVGQNWQGLLSSGISMMQDAYMRDNLPAETYIKLKTQENDKIIAEQDRLLRNLQLQADLDYQRQSIDLKREELEMERQKVLSGGSGSSYMEDAKILMGQDPTLTLQDAYALSRSGLPRGVTYNPVTGRVEEIGGFSDVTSAIGAKEKSAETTATKTAEADIEKKQTAPKIKAEADLMIKTIDETLTHPGLSAAVGAPNPLKGSLGATLDPATGQYIVRAPVGSDAKSFEAYLNQLGGQGFLQAYESLRGAAGITNIEGNKAQVARGRLNPTQSEKDFKQALKDLRDWAVSNRDKAEKIMGGNTQTIQPQTPTAPSSIDPSLLEFMTPEERALFQ